MLMGGNFLSPSRKYNHPDIEFYAPLGRTCTCVRKQGQVAGVRIRDRQHVSCAPDWRMKIRMASDEDYSGSGTHRVGAVLELCRSCADNPTSFSTEPVHHFLLRNSHQVDDGLKAQFRDKSKKAHGIPSIKSSVGQDLSKQQEYQRLLLLRTWRLIAVFVDSLWQTPLPHLPFIHICMLLNCLVDILLCQYSCLSSYNLYPSHRGLVTTCCAPSNFQEHVHAA